MQAHQKKNLRPAHTHRLRLLPLPKSRMAQRVCQNNSRMTGMMLVRWVMPRSWGRQPAVWVVQGGRAEENQPWNTLFKIPNGAS